MEARIERQRRAIELLEKSNRGTSDATQRLDLLKQALAGMKTWPPFANTNGRETEQQNWLGIRSCQEEIGRAAHERCSLRSEIQKCIGAACMEHFLSTSQAIPGWL
jgi:hypothetical protein